MEATQTPVPEKTAEQQAQENTLVTITVIERLFRAVDAGNFPLRFHDDVLSGMNFLSQFHKQLLSQLPPEVLEEARKRYAPAPTPEATNEPAKA